MFPPKTSPPGPLLPRLYLILLCACWLTSCLGATLPPSPLREDADFAVLEQAVRFGAPDNVPLVTLANLYQATGRLERGRAFFEELSASAPESGRYLAFHGLFRVLLSNTVTLTQRVGWVEESIALLDRATALDDTLPRFVRASVLARLPDRFDRSAEAMAEMEAMLEPGSFFYDESEVAFTTREGLIRGAWQSIALAQETLGRETEAEQAWDEAGGRPLDDDVVLASPYGVTSAAGFRFSRKYLWRPMDGLVVARGYDFGDIHFVVTSAGLVAIDAGTRSVQTSEALADVREEVGDLPVIAVFLTHAHWDHIGGLDALLADDPTIIASARFAEELAIVNASGIPFRWFFGSEVRRESPGAPLYDVTPDQLVAEDSSFVFGDQTFRAHAIEGGETVDALLVEWSAGDVIFAGDAFMPYAGSPFTAEGVPGAMGDVIDAILDADPALIVHGHPPLTDFYTAEALPGLALAFEHFERAVDEGIAAGRTLPQILETTRLPESLAAHPKAVQPAYVSRGNYIQRLHRLRTGYWQPDGTGIEVISEDAWAEALDLLAGSDPEIWSNAIDGLIQRGEFALAWRMSERGVLAHPDDGRLATLRRHSLVRLRDRYQQTNPFKFIVYSELADLERNPLP